MCTCMYMCIFNWKPIFIFVLHIIVTALHDMSLKIICYKIVVVI